MYKGSHVPQKPMKKKEVHPIWRGIGFVFLILVPILSYLAADVLINENYKYGWFPIPNDLLSPILDPLLFIRLIITIVIIFLLSVLFSFITFLMYAIFGPARYGPTDVPPSMYRGKKSR